MGPQMDFKGLQELNGGTTPIVINSDSEKEELTPLKNRKLRNHS